MAQKANQGKSTIERYIYLVVPIFIMVATLVIYNPSLRNSFVQGWDDMEYLNDPHVQELNAGEIFSNYHLGMYQPISVLSLAMNYNSAGPLAPQAYHATNLFLHVINKKILSQVKITFRH